MTSGASYPYIDEELQLGRFRPNMDQHMHVNYILNPALYGVCCFSLNSGFTFLVDDAEKIKKKTCS